MLKKFSPLAVAVAGVMALGAAPAMAKNEIRYAKDSILVVYKDNATKEERIALSAWYVALCVMPMPMV